MRCPKCGYISFDNVRECLKCKKDIKAASSQLKGANFNVAVPAFLHFAERKPDGHADFLDPSVEDGGAQRVDMVDEDLDVLLQNEPSITVQDEPETVTDGRIVTNEGDEEDREIEIDLNQFETFSKKEEGSPKGGVVDEDREIEAPGLSLEMPEELTDISDLAPPQAGGMPGRGLAAAKKDEVGLDLDLDNLDFDLGLVDESTEKTSAESEPPTVLALDDIDFSDALGDLQGSSDANKSKGTDMDEDFDFDLDLGGLSIHKDL